MRIIGGGKRAKPEVPEHEKLERLEVRLRSDSRSVPVAEVDKLTDALEASQGTIRLLKTNPNYVQELIYQKTEGELEEMMSLVPGGVKGRAKSLKFGELVKLLVPHATDIESGVHTAKSLFAELMVEGMCATARSHYHCSASTPDTAAVDHDSLSSAIKDALKMKRDERIRNEARQEVAQALEQQVQAEVSRRVQVVQAEAQVQADAMVD